MSLILVTKCQWCGKLFEAHSGSFIEVGLSAVHVTEEVAEECNAVDFESWTPNETIADHLGVTPEDVERLLSGEHVDTGAEAVCDDCQKAFNENLELPDPLS